MIDLDDLRNATGGQLFGETAARKFSAFCHDAAILEPGQMYVAIRTDWEDGHTHIGEAISRGATGVLCQDPPTTNVSGVTVILVGDTIAALGQWAAYILRQFGTMVIAVAGVVGKSSTAISIASVLGSQYTVYFAPNTLGGLEGLAISLSGIEPKHQIAVVELVTHRIGEMPELLAVLQPTVAVITRLIPRFASDFDRVERAVEEVRDVIQTLPRQGMAVINFDDLQARSLSKNAPSAIVTYSTNPDENTPADLTAYNVQYFIDKTGFDLRNGMQRLRGHWTPALGEPGLEAALAALAVGLLFEVPIEHALNALKQILPLPGHLTLLDGMNGISVIDDSANASVTSALAALNFLKSLDLGEGRRFLVLGDLTALPDEAEIGHREVGKFVASIANYLITVGEQALGAIRAASHAGMPQDRVVPLFRHADAIKVIKGHAQSGDVVLVTGGAEMQMQHISEGLLQDKSQADWLPRNRTERNRSVRSSSWIELNLDGLAANLAALKERVGPNVQVMAVVKANAYGHGALQIASTALHNGADLLAVATLTEALELRSEGIHQPILVLGLVPTSMLRLAVLNDLTITVWSREAVRRAARAAQELRRTIKVHLRVDTGFGDYGLPVVEVAPLVREIVRLEGIVIDGLYTDFAASDTLFEAAATRDQLDRFQGVVDSLRAAGLSIPHIHAANSAAILTLPNSYFTTVRAGILMYGLHPSLDVACPPGFHRVLCWKTTVAQVKTIPVGTPIGYGSAYRAEREMRIGLLPLGYGDGFRAGPRNWGEVLISGKRAPLVGRVSMDRCAVDVTDISDIVAGQEVVLIGCQGQDEITVEDVARRMDCINYEVVASISPRIPRIPSWSTA